MQARNTLACNELAVFIKPALLIRFWKRRAGCRNRQTLPKSILSEFANSVTFSSPSSFPFVSSWFAKVLYSSIIRCQDLMARDDQAHVSDNTSNGAAISTIWF